MSWRCMTKGRVVTFFQTEASWYIHRMIVAALAYRHLQRRNAELHNLDASCLADYFASILAGTQCRGRSPGYVDEFETFRESGALYRWEPIITSRITYSSVQTRARNHHSIDHHLRNISRNLKELVSPHPGLCRAHFFFCVKRI